MKKILIPTVFSLESLNAIRYALEVFKNTSCDFVLLHIIDVPTSIPELLTMPRDDGQLEKTNAEFESALNRINRQYAVEINSIKIVHAYGSVSDQIKAHIKIHDAEVLIYPENEILNGKNPNDYITLFNEVKIPVLFVPENFKSEQPKRVAYVIDIHDKKFLAKSSSFSTLQINSISRPILLCLIDSDKDIDNVGGSLLSLFGFQRMNKPGFTIHFIQRQNFAIGINEFINEFNIDMLLMATKRKHNFFRRPKDDHYTVVAETKVPFMSIAN
ncbi:MAG: universal stress protein [Cyclobacteriaceae bacterium]